MSEEKNAFWSFFASVKLALFNLITLAIASIIGTIIPQNEPMQVYIQKFGPGMAKFMQMLDIPGMYDSWWFVSLLVLFGLNLTVCSLDRIPRVWGVVTQNNLDTDVVRLGKMKNSETFFSSLAPRAAADAVVKLLKAKGWKPTEAEQSGGLLLFMQKGAWSRFGVYMVHLSILVIFIGAIIGSVWGFKASVMVPEGGLADKVFKRDKKETAEPMGFVLRCDKFTLSYYDNGMPREYRSELAVLKDGKEILTKSIVVNDPLDFEGLTFYQSSFQQMDGQFYVEIENAKTKSNQKFLATKGREQKWEQEGLNFGIVNLAGPDFKKDFRYKIWFSDGKSEAQTFWANEAMPVVVKGSESDYLFYVKKRYATGLQVTKDPGVWWVYGGCGLMLFGLYVAFFLSHRRLWVHISGADDSGKTKVLLSGLSNKNKFGFDKDFEKLSELFRDDSNINIGKE